MRVWAIARIIASGGQPDALLAAKYIVGRGLAPAKIQHTVDIDNGFYL